MDASGAQMSLTGLLVGIIVGQLILGPLSDTVGRRPVLLTGTTGFTALTAACAPAPTAAVLWHGAVVTIAKQRGRSRRHIRAPRRGQFLLGAAASPISPRAARIEYSVSPNSAGFRAGTVLTLPCMSESADDPASYERRRSRWSASLMGTMSSRLIRSRHGWRMSGRQAHGRRSSVVRMVEPPVGERRSLLLDMS
ncbi:hypothetical protein [Nocardia wallacei]|uniref:hypothetical protein n=1 Tax=Nocardia wallacei TaxID=480035 RepID=UPI0024549E8A|nr:hypothetical protein [Nocardia wallacei]